METVESIIGTALGDEIVEIVDRSKGYDQNVFLVTTKKSGKCIVKMPRKAIESRPPMHNPLHQAEVIQKLKSVGLAVPGVIAVTQDYLIEQCVGICDWSEKTKNMTFEQNSHVLTQLGKLVRRMHEIPTTGFSYMSEKVFVGKYTHEDGWLQMCKEEFFGSLEAAVSKVGLTKQQQEEIKGLFYENEEYLKNFKNSRLLHGDIHPNNVRLTEDLQTYLIDFADCLCGDPLMDIGRVLLELEGDWEQLQAILSGYQLDLTESLQKVVLFYAVNFELWFCEDSKYLGSLMRWNK